jgi:hypothetical protein
LQRFDKADVLKLNLNLCDRTVRWYHWTISSKGIVLLPADPVVTFRLILAANSGIHEICEWNDQASQVWDIKIAGVIRELLPQLGIKHVASLEELQQYKEGFSKGRLWSSHAGNFYTFMLLNDAL